MCSRVDRLCMCRDGTDTTALKLKWLRNLEHGSFRHITWPTSDSIHDKTLKAGKIHCHNDIQKIVDFFHHYHLLN